MGRNGYIALGALCFAVAVGLISRRPAVIVSVAVIAGIVVLTLGAIAVAKWVSRRITVRSAAEQRRRHRATQWKHYSRPDLTTNEWVVGIERVTADGLVLNRVEMAHILASDEIARLDWEGQAMTRATQYNEARVGM